MAIQFLELMDWVRRRKVFASLLVVLTLGIGILIGTYSSIAVAAPMLVAYQDWRAKRGKAAVLPAAKRARA